MAVAALAWFIPASGPRVQVRWRDTVDVDRRESLERRLHLVNPTYIQGTSWGYILGDSSPTNVWMLVNLSEINDADFVAGDPPRSTGPLIIRLAGPFAVQSYICLVLSLLVLMASFAPTRPWRLGYFASACVLFVVGWISCGLPPQSGHEIAPWMGDYTTYTEDRGHFEGYFGYDAVRFHFHLGGFVLNLIDRALGATASSPRTAFVVMSWLAGGAYLVGGSLVAVVYGWSPHSMRYLSLSMAAPLMLSFFGYRELGYLALSIGAFPFLLRGLTAIEETSRATYLALTGALQGLRSALHGFGLVGLGGSLVAALTSKGTFRSRLAGTSTLFVWGITAYLIWLLGYLLVLGLPIIPGHATGIPFRHLLEEYVAENRVVAPILSARGLRDIGCESLIVGVPVLAIGFFVARGSEERRIAAGFSATSIVFLILFWPAQGIAVDADGVFAAFPAFFAGAWMCARSLKATGLGIALLALAHAVFWFVVRNGEFLNVTA